MEESSHFATGQPRHKQPVTLQSLQQAIMASKWRHIQHYHHNHHNFHNYVIWVNCVMTADSSHVTISWCTHHPFCFSTTTTNTLPPFVTNNFGCLWVYYYLCNYIQLLLVMFKQATITLSSFKEIKLSNRQHIIKV